MFCLLKLIITTDLYLAIHAELGLEPLCFKAFKLMFKYYNRLIKIEQSKDFVYDLLRSAFDEDKQLPGADPGFVVMGGGGGGGGGRE